MAPATPAPSHAASTATTPAGAPGTAPTRGRILVVDDEPNVRAILAAALGDEGYEVATACDGFDAIREARENPPDVILLDLMMPALDGRTFLDVYRLAPGRKAPVIVITAARVTLDAEEDLGAPIVRKPFSIDRILELVRRHLHGY
ncbi:MAG TPA: response regulator [Chloroflexota bacterium]|nr:response regulator [Chloroflexota bacterium]